MFLALFGLTYFHLYVLLIASLMAVYLLQKEDQKAEVFAWSGYCLILVATLGAVVLSVGCEKASTKPISPATKVEVPSSEGMASVSGSQLTVTVEVPKGGRVGEVELVFTLPLSEGSLSDGCAGWYRAEDMWGLTWAIKMDNNIMTLKPATPKDDLVQGTWTVHISWYRGVQVPTLVNMEVK